MRLLLAAFLLLAAPAELRAACVGDCDGSDAITVDEIVTGVNLALGLGSVDSCPNFDGDGNGAITVDELLTAVRLALEGCPVEVPTATPTLPPPTATATPGITPIFPASYRQTYSEVRDCRPSVEHGGVMIRVLVNPIALQAYLDNQNPMPVGSVVVKEEFSGTACDEKDLVRWRVMRKEMPGSDADDGDWSWQWVDAGRQVLLNDKSTCIGCHARPACVARDRMCTEPGTVEGQFNQVLGNLRAALLTVSGRSDSDVFAFGADTKDGQGALALHYNGNRWKRLRTGIATDLWWVSVVPIDGHFYVAGDKGVVLRLDPDSETFTRIATPAEPTLYGVWGSAADDLWVVGGDTEQPQTGGVIWHYDGQSWTIIDTNAIRAGGIPTLFKIWGRSRDEIYAVGLAGVALRYKDGQWSEVVSNTIRPLFTVHGDDTHVVATGGFIDGVVIELDGDQFVRRDSGNLMQMNGVYVGERGAVAVGIGATAAVRREGEWLPLETLLDNSLDFHATWIDPRGGIWAVGGDLTTELDSGMLAYAGHSTVSGVIEEMPCATGSLSPNATVSYSEQIVPLFSRAGCMSISCHGGPFPSSQYDLKTYEGTFGLGIEARALHTCDVVPGNPDQSYLIEKLQASPRIGQRMPSLPLAPLSEEEIALVRRWILEGAGDDRPPTPLPTATPTPTQIVVGTPTPTGPVPTLAAACSVPGNICTVVGTGMSQFDGDGRGGLLTSLYFPIDVDFGRDGAPLIMDWNNLRLRRVRPDGRVETIMGTDVEDLPTDGELAIDTPLHHASDISFDAAGVMYVAGDHAPVVFEIGLDDRVTTTAGNGLLGYSGDGGPARSAQLATPFGVVPDENGGFFIADVSTHVVRYVDAAGKIETFAGTGERGYSGDGGPAKAAKLAGPVRLTRDQGGNLYITEAYNHVIRKVAPDGTISTVAGTGQSGYSGDGLSAVQAKLNGPYDAQWGPDGALYIADADNNVIRRVGSDGIISTVAGNGTAGFAGDEGAAASAALNCPSAAHFDSEGSLWIADTCNHRVRRVFQLVPVG